MTNDVTTARANNLRLLIRQHFDNNKAAASRSLQMNHSYICRYFATSPNKRNMSHAVARKIERHMKLKRGWMDYSQAQIDQQPAAGVPLLEWTEMPDFEKYLAAKRKGVATFLCPVPHSGRTFAGRVEGTMMKNQNGSPSFDDNDVIFIDPDVTAHSGDFVVLHEPRSNQAIFRQIITERGATMLGVALNTRMPDHIARLNNPTILGTVIAKFTRISRRL